VAGVMALWAAMNGATQGKSYYEDHDFVFV
jgi:hypothetical protein